MLQRLRLLELEKLPMLHNGPADSGTTLILAHGAGAGMDSPVMEAFAAGLASNEVRVIRFEFPYMQQRRRTGKFRGPDRLPVLMESWRNVVALADSRRLIIGGKSMGGALPVCLPTTWALTD